MGSPVVHFEIMGGDALALQGFYRDLFGWDITNMEDMGNYGLVNTRSTSGILGAVGGSQDGAAATTFYIAVPDPAATLAQIEGLGGKVLMPPTEIPGVVTFALFLDPFGHAIGLVKDDGSEAPPREDAGGASVDWFEVMGGGDTEAVTAFYEQVFGWTRQAAEGVPLPYNMMTTDGKTIGGGIGPTEDGSPFTTLYVSVPDTAASLEKATGLGASVVQPVTDVPGGPTVALFKDLAGNVIGLASSM